MGQLNNWQSLRELLQEINHVEHSIIQMTELKKNKLLRRKQNKTKQK